MWINFRDKRKGSRLMFTILLVNALFSAVFPMGKIAMSFCPPFLLVGLRMVLAGFLLGAYALYTKNNLVQFFKKYSTSIFLLALFNVYIANAFEFWGLQFMSSAKTCFIYNLAPFFSAILAYIFFKEKVTIKKIVGLLISFIGFIPILMFAAPEEQVLPHMYFLSIAELAVILATFAGVCGWLTMQHGVRHRDFNTLNANSISMFMGGIFSIGHSFCVENITVRTSDLFSIISWISALAIVTIACYVLYTHLLKKFSTTFLTFTGLTGPFFAALYDWLIFGTVITWHFYCATALVFIGLYLFYQDEFSIKNIIQ